jgi:phage gp45-like
VCTRGNYVRQGHTAVGCLRCDCTRQVRTDVHHVHSGLQTCSSRMRAVHVQKGTAVLVSALGAHRQGVAFDQVSAGSSRRTGAHLKGGEAAIFQHSGGRSSMTSHSTGSASRQHVQDRCTIAQRTSIAAREDHLSLNPAHSVVR